MGYSPQKKPFDLTDFLSRKGSARPSRSSFRGFSRARSNVREADDDEGQEALPLNAVDVAENLGAKTTAETPQHDEV